MSFFWVEPSSDRIDKSLRIADGDHDRDRERMRSLRLGAGAGFSGDPIAPAPAHAPAIDLDYLIFECLGERTVALAQQARAADPDAGYDPLFEHRLRAVLPVCRRKGARIITNMGAANPMAAARAAVAIARELGASGLRIAVVSGDDVLERIGGGDHALAIGGTPAGVGDTVVAATAISARAPSSRRCVKALIS